MMAVPQRVLMYAGGGLLPIRAWPAAHYAELARGMGCQAYVRAPALGVEPSFISGLAHMVGAVLGREPCTSSADGLRWCPKGFAQCPSRAAA